MPVQNINLHQHEPMLIHEPPRSGQGVFLHELLQVQERERTRIARELHDGLGQMLALLQSHLSSSSRDTRDVTLVQRSCAEAAGQVQRILDEVRRITLELMPAVLDDLGLDAAIRTLFHDCLLHHIRIAVDMPVVNDLLPAEQHIHFYRILQETFSNIAHHSQASEVTIHMCRRDGSLECMITDNGIGFHPPARDVRMTGSHCGLRNMQARAELLCGALTIESEPGLGTSVRIAVPLEANGVQFRRRAKTAAAKRAPIP